MSSQPKPDRSGDFSRTQVPPNVESEALHAERRQLTVAFVDIVGSTPLSERIDPEEFFAVIKNLPRYLRRGIPLRRSHCQTDWRWIARLFWRAASP